MGNFGLFFLVFAFIAHSSQCFGMSKDEVLRIVKIQLEQKHNIRSSFDELTSKIQEDKSLTSQEWDLFVRKISTIPMKSPVILRILAEYYFQVASHYVSTDPNIYDLKKAMEYYERAAFHGHTLATRQFAFLGIDSQDIQMRTRAYGFLEQCSGRASQDPCDWDAESLNCLGVHYECRGLRELAYDCYKKAVDRLQHDNVEHPEELNAWKNDHRLRDIGDCTLLNADLKIPTQRKKM